jgi:hypothetical protein
MTKVDFDVFQETGQGWWRGRGNRVRFRSRREIILLPIAIRNTGRIQHITQVPLVMQQIIYPGGFAI